MKKTKRTCALLLTLSLLLGGALPIFAEEAETMPYAVGDQLNGFTVTEVGIFDLLGAPTVLLTHDKTGATVYYIAADDVNRAFDISFRTPVLDDMGTPHVFEHITISGSEKYPSSNLVFTMMSQTYNTFVNAMTMSNATTYPLGSLSEDQLLKMADVYLDGVFHPMLYNDERLYRREAWRYELPDAESDLTITGTVYNEMKGARTISRVAQQHLMQALYPDSLQGNEAGGDPASIPDLTYQHLLDFHDAYYHPSNALVVLYGSLDLAPWLTLLDGYFAQYDQEEIEVPTGDIPAQDTFVEQSYAFPVENGSPVEGGSYILYGFVANDATEEEEVALEVLAGVLSHSASPLQVALREALPGATCSVSLDYQTPRANLVFSASGVNQDDAERFKQTVDGALAQIAQDGLDAELVQAVLSTLQFSMLTLPEMSNLGTTLAPSVAMMWAREGDTYYFNDYLTELNTLSARDDDTSAYVDLLNRFVLSNPHAALTVTYPEPGLSEQNAAALAENLAAYKASLSEEQIQQLVDQTAEMAAFSAEEPSADIIKELQAVTVDTLPEEIDRYVIKDVPEDGVRYLSTTTQAGEIGLTNIMLDTAWVPVEDLHYLQLYTALVGRLDTTTHAKEELALLNTRYLNGLTVSAGMMETPGKVYRPVLGAQWMGLLDGYQDGVALTKEILFETKFDNIEDIRSQIITAKTGLHQMLTMVPYQYQINRGFAAFTDHDAYDSYLNGIEYYNALTAIEQQLDDDPETVTAKLAEIQQGLLDKENALAYFVGNEDAVQSFETNAPSFFEGMNRDKREAADYSGIPKPAMREALVVDSAVQYNMIYAPLETLGLEMNGTLATLSQVLYDAYLTPKLRHGAGAYDSLTLMNRNGIVICSYRDPEVAKTFEVFDGLGDFLRTTTLTQEDLDRYIIKTYSSYAMPTGALNGGANALNLYLAGRSQEEKLERMQEMKAFTVEDLKAYAPVFDTLREEGARSTAGSASVIEANSELYDAVLRVE